MRVGSAECDHTNIENKLEIKYLMPFNKLTGLAVSAIATLALAACSSTTGESAGPDAPSSQPFEISSASVSPMTRANLCSDLGGEGQAPTITIRHTAEAGVPISIRLTDYLSNGSTFNHRSTRVTSHASGTTTVNYAFLPPCNTTNGRTNSDYRFTINAGGASETVTWARFNSATKTIN